MKKVDRVVLDARYPRAENSTLMQRVGELGACDSRRDGFDIDW